MSFNKKAKSSEMLFILLYVRYLSGAHWDDHSINVLANTIYKYKLNYTFYLYYYRVNDSHWCCSIKFCNLFIYISMVTFVNNVYLTVLVNFVHTLNKIMRVHLCGFSILSCLKKNNSSSISCLKYILKQKTQRDIYFSHIYSKY